MSEVKNCMKCGLIFKSVSGLKVCSECMTSDDDFFKVVRDYIYDHPGAIISEVSRAVNVSEEKILDLIRQGRIQTN